MNKERKGLGGTTFKSLRQQAETLLGQKKESMDFPSSPEKTRRLIHELQTHQIELELQNEELLQAQGKIVSAQ